MLQRSSFQRKTLFCLLCRVKSQSLKKVNRGWLRTAQNGPKHTHWDHSSGPVKPSVHFGIKASFPLPIGWEGIHWLTKAIHQPHQRTFLWQSLLTFQFSILCVIEYITQTLHTSYPISHKWGHLSTPKEELLKAPSTRWTGRKISMSICMECRDVTHVNKSSIVLKAAFRRPRSSVSKPGTPLLLWDTWECPTHFFFYLSWGSTLASTGNDSGTVDKHRGFTIP